MRKKTDAEDVPDHDAAAFEETRNRRQKNRHKGRDARTAQPAAAQLATLRGWLSVPDDYELLTDAADSGKTGVELYFIMGEDKILHGEALVSEVKVTVKADDKTEVSFSFEGVGAITEVAAA